MKQIRTLPPVTVPPDVPTGRAHVPKPANDYKAYRSCLRWEFGFSCSFCLLHEADFDPVDAEGAGVMWIEHILTQTSSPGEAAKYSNCVFACRFCNRARGTTLAVEEGTGRKLLDPSLNAWSLHFSLDNYTLKPVEGDDDAAYTAEAYQPHDARKTFYRVQRAERFKDIATIPVLLSMYERLLEKSESEPDEAETYLMEATAVRRAIKNFLDDLDRYVAVPAKAPEKCRCQHPQPLMLPPWLSDQTALIDRPPG